MASEPVPDGMFPNSEAEDEAFIESLKGIPPEVFQRYRSAELTPSERKFLQELSDTHPTSPRRPPQPVTSSEPVRTAEESELLRKIRSGESETLEFKSRWTPSIWNVICAFANTVGGEIIVGVKDDGEIIGAARSLVEGNIRSQIDRIFQRPIPEVEIERVTVDGKEVAIISVKPLKR